MASDWAVSKMNFDNSDHRVVLRTKYLMELQDEKYKHLQKLHDVSTTETERSGKRIQELSSRSDQWLTVFFQVLGFYLVFEGVVFTAVLQSDSFNYGNLWAAYSLSLTAGICCCFPVYIIGDRVAVIKEELAAEEVYRRRAMDIREDIEWNGKKVKVEDFEDNYKMPKMSKTLKKAPFLLVILFILVFTLLICMSIWRVVHDKP